VLLHTRALSLETRNRCEISLPRRQLSRSLFPLPPSARPPAQLRRWTAPSAPLQPLPILSTPPMAPVPAQSSRRPRQTLAPPPRVRWPLAPSSYRRGPAPAQLWFPPCHFRRGSKARVQGAARRRRRWRRSPSARPRGTAPRLARQAHPKLLPHPPLRLHHRLLDDRRQPRPPAPRATCSMKWRQGKISFFWLFFDMDEMFTSRIVTCA
jgi:hypothetical protein